MSRLSSASRSLPSLLLLITTDDGLHNNTTHRPLCSLCVAFSIVIDGKRDNATVMVSCRLPIMVREAVTTIEKAAADLKISMKVNIDDEITWHEGGRAELEEEQI